MKKPNPELVAELIESLNKTFEIDLTKVCGNERPQHKGMLGGPKYICTMIKGHEGECFQRQKWSSHC